MNDDNDDSWTLYALSRVADWFLLPHQPPDPDDIYATVLPADGAYEEWMAGLGATAVDEMRFHPFLHEIVDVEVADDPAEQPVILRRHWRPARSHRSFPRLGWKLAMAYEFPA